MPTIVIIIIAVALLFDFMNGRNDAANSIATVVSTRVLTPFLGVLWAAFWNFAALFIFGVHVAKTVGKGIVESSVINEYVILTALISAILWVYTCQRYGLPNSVSHALIGGLIGPALLEGGRQALIASGIIKVAVFIVIAPVFGAILGFLVMSATMWVFRKTAPRKVDALFRVMQLVSSAIFSLGHGSNDAQKTIGIISILLFTSGQLGPEFYIPAWVIFASYLTIALGTIAGGKKVIKTLGTSLTHLKPVQGFCAETAGAFSVILATVGGVPVSTTHTITGSIMGVGVAKRLTAVRWGVASDIVKAWILTIPVNILLSGAIYAIIKYLIISNIY